MVAMTTDPADDRYRGLPRIGDAERQAAVDALSDHYVAGRLDINEFNARMDAAMQARTAADLAPLFADLPGAGSPAPEVPFEHQALAPAMPPYLPATPPPPGDVPATTGGRSRAQTLQLIRTLVWPIAIVLIISTGADAMPVIGAALLVSILVGRLLKDERAKQAELPPGPDDPSADPYGPYGPYGSQPPGGPRPPYGAPDPTQRRDPDEDTGPGGAPRP